MNQKRFVREAQQVKVCGFRAARGAALSVVVALLAATLCAIVAPVTAAAQTQPNLQTYPLPADVNVTGQIPTVLISENLILQPGESRRLIGQASATMLTTGLASMDFTLGIQCFDYASGAQVGDLSYAETSLVPGATWSLRPSLLLTIPVLAPSPALYTCQLVASTADGVTMTVFASLTNLMISTGDETGSQMWTNPPCDSSGTQQSCVYFGGPQETNQSAYVFHDGVIPTIVPGWAASMQATSAHVTANMELTECGHTASCGGRRGDYDHSTVHSQLEAVQLDASGRTCKVTRTLERTDIIGILPHHYNIPYDLEVPVLATCGSRDFIVRLWVAWVDGNTVKIDGFRPDPLTQTNAFIINSNYAPTTVVPRVINLPLGNAQTPGTAQYALASEQLTVGKVTTVADTSPAGTVLAQNAPENTVEPINSPVDLTVSGGDVLHATQQSNISATQWDVESIPFTATGGTAPYTWSVSAPTGLGLTLNATTGVYSGTLKNYGTFTVNYTVRDAVGNQDTKSFTVSVAKDTGL